MKSRVALTSCLALVACAAEPIADAPAPAAAEPGSPGTTPACVLSPAAAGFPSDDACGVILPAARDGIDDALAVIGRDRCTLGLDLGHVERGWMNARDRRAVAEFAPMLARPLRMPSYAAETAKWMDDALASDMPVSRALAAAATRQGSPVTACAEPSFFAGTTSARSPLAAALALDSDAFAGVPAELQHALVPIVRALAWANAEVIAAFGATKPTEIDGVPEHALGKKRSALRDALLAKIDAVDVARIVRASVVVATTVESARLARFVGAEVPSIDVETSFGPIVLRGPRADEHRVANAALLLDTGGDDVYRVPVAATTSGRFVSIAIDLAGSDTYGYVESAKNDPVDERLPSDGAPRSSGATTSQIGRQGSGVAGIGMLFDLDGADSYRSLTRSQGVGALGVGVLYDGAGDDTYAAEAFSQGAAAWGIGMLLDRSGNDRYFGYTGVQAYGFTRGAAILVDADGDDLFETDVGDPALGGHPIYESPQLPGKGNTSMAQGCARGLRATEALQGLPGGLGILRDARGNDRYLTSVFGQASGYLLGIGMLLDGAGDDTYEGLWYVQGANAHTALSYFHDRSGNDRYNPTYPVTATSIGVGHDLGAAVHFDEGGNDTYRAPGLTLGAGNKNGIGVFVNAGGDDVFEGQGVMMGAANSAEVLEDAARLSMPTIGVFVKAGGGSTYLGAAPVGSGAAPGATWSTTPNKTKGANEIAVGVDRPGASAALP